MIDFGNTLRAAREAKGLTPNDVAEKTHMMVQIVNGLESEDFRSIVAPIYGRGYVKLYCETVGITDFKPLVDEFMEIYNGNRAPNIRTRSVDLEPEPVPAAAPSATEAPAASATVSQPTLEGILPKEAETIPPPPAARPLPSPVVAPHPQVRMPSRPTPSMPRPAFRLALLAFLALVVLLLVLAGARAIYRAATTVPADESPVTVEEPMVTKPEPAKAEPAKTKETPAAPARKREPITLDALYIS